VLDEQLGPVGIGRMDNDVCRISHRGKLGFPDESAVVNACAVSATHRSILCSARMEV
jgi:hypothetical protein